MFIQSHSLSLSLSRFYALLRNFKVELNSLATISIWVDNSTDNYLLSSWVAKIAERVSNNFGGTFLSK